MRFEKVSYDQYRKDVGGDVDLWDEYKDIKLPKRATVFSAGYDLRSPRSTSYGPAHRLTQKRSGNENAPEDPSGCSGAFVFCQFRLMASIWSNSSCVKEVF